MTEDNGGYRRKDLWDKAAIATKLVFSVTVPIAAILISNHFSVNSLERQLAAEKEKASQQIRADQERDSLQRKVSEAQLATTMLPTLISGQLHEKKAALTVLSHVAPTLAQSLTEDQAFLQRIQPENGANAKEFDLFVKEVKAATVKHQIQIGFQQHIESAGKYMDLDLWAQASREYFTAYSLLSEELKKLKSDAFSKARANYERGNFSVSAHQMRDALDSVARFDTNG